MNDGNSQQNPASSFGQTLSRIAATTLKLIGARFDQAIVELELEIHNAVAALIWGIALVATACLTLGFLGLLVVIAFWDSHPLLAALGVAVVFGLLAVVAALRVRRALGSQGTAIAGVRTEVAADLAALERHRDASGS